MGKQWKQWEIFIIWGSKITADGDCSHEIKRCLLLGKKSYDQPRQYIKKQRPYFAIKGPSSQSYGFSSSRVWMWELDYKESWALKNWCFSTVVLEKTLKSPLDSKEIQPVHPKGNQSWMLIGRTDAEAETSILWPPDARNWLIGKDPDSGKDWRQKEKGTTENELVGWHYQLNGWVWVSSGSWCWTGIPGCSSPWAAKNQTWLSKWTGYQLGCPVSQSASLPLIGLHPHLLQQDWNLFLVGASCGTLQQCQGTFRVLFHFKNFSLYIGV